MTSPRNLPQFGTWSVPDCQLAIDYDLEILDQIRREVTLGFQAPQGGREVGGLLLGSYESGRIRIAGFEPVRCDHTLGPNFILTESDTNALTAQLAAREDNPAAGNAVVGWYQSHLRRGLTLSNGDVQIYDRHFPKPWQVALLLRPDPAGGIHARFFLREPAKASIPNGTAGAKHDGPAPVEAAEPTAPVPRRGIQTRSVWIALAGMFVLAVVAVFYMRFHFALVSRASGVVPLEAAYRNGALELRWDPKALSDAATARLEIRDGAQVQQIALDRGTLASGRFSYRQNAGVTGFRLHAERSNGALLEGSAVYVAGNTTATPAPVPAPVPVATAEPPITVQPASPPPAPQPVRTEAPKTRADSPPTAPPVAPPAARTVEQPKTSAATNVSAPPKQEEPAKPKTEPPPQAPAVQTAQVQRQTAPELPAPVPAVPPARLETAAAAPPSRVPPKESVPAPVAAAPAMRLAGHWTLQSGGYSRSPAVPESVSITVSENDGSVQGNLEARYKSRSKPVRVHFSFAGKVVNGAARFAWTSSEGKRGQIEFIRVPNSPDLAEVVWQNPDSNHVFDEMVRRAN